MSAFIIRSNAISDEKPKSQNKIKVLRFKKKNTVQVTYLAVSVLKDLNNV